MKSILDGSGQGNEKSPHGTKKLLGPQDLAVIPLKIYYTHLKTISMDS